MIRFQAVSFSKLLVISAVFFFTYRILLLCCHYSNDSKVAVRPKMCETKMKATESRLPSTLVQEEKQAALNNMLKAHAVHYQYWRVFTPAEMKVQEDPITIDIIRRYYLHEPSSKKDPYILDRPDRIDHSVGQTKAVLRILKNMRNGFFVECGGLDGELSSNTLYMERFLNWTGILIEPGKSNFKKLIRKNRKAWSSDTCMSLKRIPEMVAFHEAFDLGHVVNENESKKNAFHYAQCFPFYSYLLALNVTTVDYFSLDIEGLEMEVLKTIPFHKVLIKVISIEDISKGTKKEEYIQFMEKVNYTFVQTCVLHGYDDYIFKHNSVYPDEILTPIKCVPI